MYVFSMLSTGTLAPSIEIRNGKKYLPPWIPEWLDLNFMVPLIATVIVVAVGILVICVAISRRRIDDSRGCPKDVYCRSTHQIHMVLWLYSTAMCLKTKQNKNVLCVCVCSV